MHSRELLNNVKKLKNSVGDLDQLQISAATNIVDALNEVKTSVEQVEVSLEGYATEEFITNKIAEAKLDGSEVDLSDYVTKSQLDLKADETALTSHTNNAIIHITADERTAWNAKSNFSGNYNDLTNKPTIPSAYVHPSSHAATMITEDTTHRFVTDAEKTTWNNKSDLILGITSSTAFRGDQGNTAYIHSQATHAPANAQANADITKEEIEAKLTNEISSHFHTNSVIAEEEVNELITNIYGDSYLEI